MAVRQTGRRVRDEAPRRGAERKHTAPAVRPSRRGKREALAPSERRRLIQMVACGGVFVLLVAVKLLLPDRLAQVNGRLTGMLEQNMDVRAVFSAVGRAVSGEADVDVALQDVYQAVFRPQELSPAVEAAAAPAGEEVDLLPPDVMAPLRSFRSGTGTSDGWLLPPSPEQENGTGGREGGCGRRSGADRCRRRPGGLHPGLCPLFGGEPAGGCLPGAVRAGL